MTKRDYAEDRLQAAIVHYLRTVTPESVTFAVPNGGARTKAEAAKLKWTGVLAGIPDLICATPRGVIFFEVKSDDGRLSPAQKERHEELRGLGFTVAVVRSVDDVRLTLRAVGVRTREAEAMLREIWREP